MGGKAKIPASRLAKPVLLEDERGHLLAVLPATRRISMASLEKETRRKLELTSEDDLEEISFDCERGAIPSVGPACDIPTAIDESLLQARDIYLEGGDREELVHLDAVALADLLAGSRRCSFAFQEGGRRFHPVAAGSFAMGCSPSRRIPAGQPREIPLAPMSHPVAKPRRASSATRFRLRATNSRPARTPPRAPTVGVEACSRQPEV